MKDNTEPRNILGHSIQIGVILFVFATLFSGLLLLTTYVPGASQRSHDSLEEEFRGSIIVYFNSNASYSRRGEIVSSVSGTISVQQTPDVSVVTFHPALTVEKAIKVIKALEQFPEVKFATPYFWGVANEIKNHS